MHQPVIPLLAAGLDWLEGLLPVVFVVIWIVSQVMNLFRGARRGEARPLPPRPAPPPGGDAADGRVPPDMHREIEEFLRRSLEGGSRPRAEPAVGPAAPPRRRPRRPTVEQPTTPAAARPSEPAGTDVASHVATAFAHDLAHESPDTTSPIARPEAASVGGELLAALRAPGGLRQLLLMQEVLVRPTHRW